MKTTKGFDNSLEAFLDSRIDVRAGSREDERREVMQSLKAMAQTGRLGVRETHTGFKARFCIDCLSADIVLAACDE